MNPSNVPFIPLTADGARMIEAQRVLMGGERRADAELMDYEIETESPNDSLDICRGLMIGIPVGIVLWLVSIAALMIAVSAIAGGAR